MRQQMSTLLTVARELEYLGPRHQLCASLKRFKMVLEPLLVEHGIALREITPPTERGNFDVELNKKFIEQAVRTSQSHDMEEKEEVRKLYALFAEMMEQYCVSSKQLERTTDARAAR